MHLSFLTPAGSLVVLAAVIPLVALVIARRRSERVSRVLGVPAADYGLRPRALLLVGTCAAFAFAAAQPYIRTTSERSLREDAEAMFVVDVSRSMRAASGPGSPTRLARAKAEAERLQASISHVPSGLAGLTDRVLPYAFPTGDRRVFGATLRDAVRLESPPPQGVARVASTFAALTTLRAGFFSPGVRTRICVVLTDGESQSFPADATGRALEGPGGCRLIVVQFWRADEHVYGADRKPEPQYRPDAAAASNISALAQAAGGRSFGEAQGGAARQALLEAVGTGRARSVTIEQGRRALALWAALAGLLLAVALVALAVLPSLLRPRRDRIAQA
jgi:hypothetical protein